MCLYRHPDVPWSFLRPLAWRFVNFWGSYGPFLVGKTQKVHGKAQKWPKNRKPFRNWPVVFDPTKYRPKVPKRRKNMFFSTFSSRWSDCARSRSILKNIFKKVLSFKKVVHKKLNVHFRPTKFPNFTSKTCAIDRSPRQLSGDMKIFFLKKFSKVMAVQNYFGRK